MNERCDRNDDPENPFGGYRADGLYALGPLGMRCALGILIDQLIARSLVRVRGRSPDAERIAKIRTRGADLQRKFTPAELREMERERRQPRLTYVGGFLKSSGKRPNSGRKRRVAA
jgi:hypothetical protein